MIFIRFLHLLAHHPDFQLSDEAIPDIVKYVDPVRSDCSATDTTRTGISSSILTSYARTRTWVSCTTWP